MGSLKDARKIPGCNNSAQPWLPRRPHSIPPHKASVRQTAPIQSINMGGALQLSVASTLLFCLAALVVKPSPYRRVFMAPIVLGVAYFFRSALQFHYHQEYACACLVLSQLFLASDYILLTDVQRDLFVQGQKEPAFRLSLFERVKWALSLLINYRCVGWSHEPTYALPPRPLPSVTRQRFIFQELGRLARDIILSEVLTTYAHRSGYFAMNGRSLAADGLFWRMVNVLVYGFSAIVYGSMGHRAFGILGVLSGCLKPQEWVPLFGSLYDAYTLHNFWG